MKKSFFLIFVLICMMVAGCGTAGKTDLADDSWVPVLEIERLSATGAMILFQVDQPPQDYVILSGNDYSLQILTDNGWEDLPKKKDHVTWVKDAFVITAVPRDDIDWEWLYGSLSAGEYRICKEVALYHQDQVVQRATVYAEFRLG